MRVCMGLPIPGFFSLSGPPLSCFSLVKMERSSKESDALLAVWCATGDAYLVYVRQVSSHTWHTNLDLI